MKTIRDLLRECEQEEYVSIRALAVRFKVSEKTISRELKKVQLPEPQVLFLGREIRIHQDGVKALILAWARRHEARS